MGSAISCPHAFWVYGCNRQTPAGSASGCFRFFVAWGLTSPTPTMQTGSRCSRTSSITTQARNVVPDPTKGSSTTTPGVPGAMYFSSTWTTMSEEKRALQGEGEARPWWLRCQNAWHWKLGGYENGTKMGRINPNFVPTKLVLNWY